MSGGEFSEYRERILMITIKSVRDSNQKKKTGILPAPKREGIIVERSFGWWTGVAAMSGYYVANSQHNLS